MQPWHFSQPEYAHMTVLAPLIHIELTVIHHILQKNGAYSFKGMSYAAPPVGKLRWAPPVDPVCRDGVTDATRFRGVCPQVQPLSSTGKVIGQEGCLFINVWTPTLKADANLPVMVWIHGGYLHMFSGSEQAYSPTEKLAAETGMVYVSFNYRLNAFGFLALEILREGSPKNTSGQLYLYSSMGFHFRSQVWQICLVKKLSISNNGSLFYNVLDYRSNALFNKRVNL